MDEENDSSTKVSIPMRLPRESLRYSIVHSLPCPATLYIYVLLLSFAQSITIEIKVYMHCNACERKVRRTISKVEGEEVIRRYFQVLLLCVYS